MRKALLCGAALLAALPSVALAQDVVMRRPLPVKPGVQSTPDDCQLTGVCPDPEDPIVPGDAPPGRVYVYNWEPGPWKGTGQCGVPSTLTRSIKCTAYDITDFINNPGPIGPGGPQEMSFGPTEGDQATLSPAIFDPDSSDVKLALAQVIGPDGRPIKTYNVAPSYCEAQAFDPKPEATYTGDTVSCQYEIVTPGDPSFPTNPSHPDQIDPAYDTAWELPPGAPGTATCSADAYRQIPYACRRTSDGAIVDKTNCTDNRTPGGVSVGEPGYEYGNMTGCKANWVTQTSDLGCHAENDPTGTANGPVHYVSRKTVCQRSDGVVLTGVDEAKCDIDPDRPFDGIVVAGQCERTFDKSEPLGGCVGHRSGQSSSRSEMESWRTVVFAGTMEQGGAKACADSGATCCQERRNFTKQITETVGSNKTVAQVGYGSYKDDGVLVEGAGTTTSYQGVVYKDSVFGTQRVTGHSNWGNCPYQIGELIPHCGYTGSCQTERVEQEFPGPLYRCNPSTMYYKYEQEELVATYGASGPKWKPPAK